GAQREALVAEQLVAVGLAGADLHSYPSRYSGGGRQRIAIARALISAPSVLVCDEPTSSLDVSVQSQIVNLLLDAGRERDLSMLFVSHDLDLIGRVVHTVAVMYGGRVVETGPASLIRRSPRRPYTQALHGDVHADPPRRRQRAGRTIGVGGGSVAGVVSDVEAGTAGVPEAGGADQIGAEPTAPAWIGADHRDNCVFAARCPRAEARCRQERPPMTAEGGGRSFACFYPI